jgi:hypothetical protein
MERLMEILSLIQEERKLSTDADERMLLLLAQTNILAVATSRKAAR